MKPTTYWNKVTEELVEYNVRLTNESNKKLHGDFNKVRRDIFKDLSMYFDWISEEGKLDIQRLNAKMTRAEREAFQESIQSFLKSNGEDLSKNFAHMLKKAGDMGFLTKSMAIRWEIYKHVDLLYEKVEEEIRTIIQKTYIENYYRSIFNVSRFEGMGDFKRIKFSDVQKITLTPWVEGQSNFQGRLLRDKLQTVNELESKISQYAVQGKTAKEAQEEIAKIIDKAERKTATLNQWENAHFSNQAMGVAYEEGTSEEYQIIATLDLNTTPKCRKEDKKIYKHEEKVIGETYPPFEGHKCRSVAIPYYDYELDYGRRGKTRMARNPITGKSERVSDMNYREWYSRYVESSDEAKEIERKLKEKKRRRKKA